MNCAQVCRHLCSICDLPLELFYWIQEHVDINNLLLTSSRLTAYRRQLYRWRLSRKRSMEYMLDRDMKLPFIADSAKQLCVVLSLSSRVTDVSALSNVHTLNISCCNKVTDVSALCNVHTLIMTCLHWAMSIH